MQKHVNLVDRVKSFPTNIFLQNLASTQKRTSPIKFAHLAEKSEKGSMSNFSLIFSQMSKLYRARSLLYRRQILQVNIRWKTLDEIYKIYMLLHRSDLSISAKFVKLFRIFRQSLETLDGSCRLHSRSRLTNPSSRNRNATSNSALLGGDHAGVLQVGVRAFRGPFAAVSTPQFLRTFRLCNAL